MQILVILGSRNPSGQTATAVDACVEGIMNQGGTIQRIHLPQGAVERCRQCEANGWGICITEGKCVIEDDFAQLVDAIRKADAVVFATPVYWGDLSESLRAFLDRLRRITRYEGAREGIAGKQAIGIAVAGGGGGGGPTCIVSMEKILRTCGFDVVDLIPARRQNLALKQRVLRITGEWLVTGA